MPIDMATLKSTTYGDSEAKLTVKRGWLSEVYRLLIEGASYKQKYQDLRRQLDEQGIHVTTSTISPEAKAAAERDIDEGMEQVDKGMDRIFGKGGAFDKIFHRKR